MMMMMIVIDIYIAQTFIWIYSVANIFSLSLNKVALSEFVLDQSSRLCVCRVWIEINQSEKTSCNWQFPWGLHASKWTNHKRLPENLDLFHCVGIFDFFHNLVPRVLRLLVSGWAPGETLENSKKKCLNDLHCFTTEILWWKNSSSPLPAPTHWSKILRTLVTRLILPKKGNVSSKLISKI